MLEYWKQQRQNRPQNLNKILKPQIKHYEKTINHKHYFANYTNT